MKLSAILVVLALAGACQPTPTPEEAAAVFVVEDMLGRVQPEGASITDRYIGSTWQGPPPIGPVYPVVVETSGLPALSSEAWRSEDSARLVLNLFRPVRLGGDSMRVIAEWLIFEPGESFWGTQYDYALDCSARCRLLVRHGPGYLN